MKTSKKNVLKVLYLMVFVSGAVLVCKFMLPIVIACHDWSQQMKKGQKFMDSLTENDFQIWSERTQTYLSNFNPTNLTVEGEAIPPELKKLGVVRIDAYSNYVNYVWMGGFDHTLLHVERLAAGQLEFTAMYNDQSNRVIWPKASNLKN